jgi:hypothetical protein
MAITHNDSLYSTFNDEFSTNDGAVYYYDGSTYTASTDNANMDYFSDSAVAGHAMVFRMSANSFKLPQKLQFNVGTALSGTDVVLKWYISSHTNQPTTTGYHEIEWIDVTSHITDDTNGFTTTGTNSVHFDQWVQERFSAGKFTPITTGNSIWIKCEIDSLTSITEGGANTTDALRSYYNRVTVNGSYDSGTITSLYGTGSYGFYDTSKSWTPGELVGRYVWFYDSSTADPVCFPIKSNTATRIQMGHPQSQAPSGDVSPPDVAPTIGDSYVISYKMEDIYDYLVTQSKDWVTPSVWRPRDQSHAIYVCNCEIYIDATASLDYTLLGSMSEHLDFLMSSRLLVNNSYTLYNKFATGMRGRKRNQDNSGWISSDKITGLGSTIAQESNGVGTYSSRFSGWMYSYKFHNGCKYSFVSYHYLTRCDIRNSYLENCQVGDGTETTGWNLIHAPVAEPLRVPANTFTVKGFQADKSCIYMTSPVSRVLDSPASDTDKSFTCYSQFTTPHILNIIDKDSLTLKEFSYGAASATLNSGTFAFWYRVNVKVLDEQNNPIENARVSIYNSSGELQFTDTTDSNGLTKDEYSDAYDDVDNKVHESDWYHVADGTTGTKTDFVEDQFGPFDIVISKSGYEILKDKLQIERAENLVYNLSPILSYNQHKSINKQ